MGKRSPEKGEDGARAARWRCVAPLLVLLPLSVQAAAPGEAPVPAGQVITLWVRPNGNAEPRRVPIDLAARNKVEVTREDVQYPGERLKYRGVSLRALMDVMERTNRADLVLLHFDNGMSVPLPIDDLELLKALDPFVATELQVNDLWISAFPMVKKPGAEERDARPLKFKANKLVVSSRLHPFTSAAAQADGFTPFLFTGTLTGIEFVRSAEWYRQFDVGTTAQEKAGFALFKSHCQYCHAVRERGGQYGTDFITSGPVAERVSLHQLYLHVRYRDRAAAEKGQMMPFFKDLSKDDVAALHAWLSVLTRARPRPYVAGP
jgi:mono/diheme cytochrome c family protein